MVKPSFDKAFAYEVKWNATNINPRKYRKFTETYPDIPLKCIAFSAENVEKALQVIKL